jgi:hypothetical protein
MKVHKVTYLTYFPTFIFHNYDYSTNYYTFINQKDLSISNVTLLGLSLFIPCFAFVQLIICNKIHIIVAIFLFSAIISFACPIDFFFRLKNFLNLLFFFLASALAIHVRIRLAALDSSFVIMSLKIYPHLCIVYIWNNSKP